MPTNKPTSSRRRAPVVLQSTRFDCGPACLASALAAHGRPTLLANVRESLDPGRDGVSALDLRDEARRRGLSCTGRRVGRDIAAIARLPRPFLAHWEGDHYVVVTGVGRRGVSVMDPAVGRRRLDAETYLRGATGVVLTFGGPAPDNTDSARPDRRAGPSPLRTIVAPAALTDRRALVVLAVTSLVLLGVGLTVPAWTAQVVDAFVAGTGPGSLVAPIVGVPLAVAAATLVRGIAAASLQRRIGEALRSAFVERFLAAPLTYVERRGPGELASRIMAADVLPAALATRLVGAVLDALTGVVYLAVVVVVAPVLGIVTAALAAGQLAVLGLFAVRGRRLRREELLAEARSASWLFEIANGVAWVKGAGAEQVAGQRAARLHSRQLTALHLAACNGAVAEAVAAAVRIGGPLLLLVVAATTLPAVTAGGVVALAGLGAAALLPLGSIAGHLRELYEIGSVVDHLHDLATAPPESTGPGLVPDRLSGAISANGLGFRFTRRSAMIVEDVSFRLPPGAKLAIVGASGSGKSTLAKLLVGLYRPTTGRVELDGADLATLDLPSTRRLMGAVWQDPLLFSGSIAQNIALRVPDATPDAIRTAARLAGIDADIEAMPMGYDTILGPSGEGLSGGQRQRLALARALVGRPAVLVLDEATSHLDTPTEALVEQNLRDIGVTRIVIAHRLSTVQDADLVLVMASGQVVEHGTHDELVERGGEYARMITAQQTTSPTVAALAARPTGPEGWM